MIEQTEWRWYVGKDEERYTTECVDRDEAVYIAREEYEGAHIIEACKPVNIPISGYFHAGRFIEYAEDAAYDVHADPESGEPVFDLEPEQMADLQAMVRAAMDEWQAKHGLTFQGFAFSASRNGEYIPAKEEEDA